MKKLSIYFSILFVAVLVTAGCTKLQPEITSLDTDRLFSPVDLEARVVNKTSVRLVWKQVAKAGSYDVELFDNGDLDFSGSPSRTVSGVTFDELPLVVPNLDGETEYSVRVRAAGSDIADSKWVSTTFETDPEQIFLPVDVADIEATSVILRWTAGGTVTKIVLSPGDITHDISAAEAQAGAATIEGLTGETEYTAQILNGSKVRGTVTFTTLIDLGNAIAVTPDDDFVTMLSEAEDGDVFGLLPGVYNIPKLVINKSVSIQGARPAEKPVLMSTLIQVTANVSLSLKDLILDGTGSGGDQTLVFSDAGNNGALKVEGCEISNYTKGLMYVNKATSIESVLFTGNIIYNIECSGGDFIDFRQGLTPSFDFYNNTVYNSALARDLFRMDAGGSSNFPSVNSNISITNNTFYQVCDGSNRRVLYIRLANHGITFSKNIIANTQGYYTNQSSTRIETMEANNYFNAPNFTGSTASNAQNDSGNYTMLDPGFTNAANGDFTISNEDLKFGQIGDTRWIK